MDIYHYSKDTGEYVGQSEATPDPLDKGSFLIPAYATEIKPLDHKAGFAVCFRDSAWEYIEDNRGKASYDEQTLAEKTIDYLGAVEDGYTLLKPEWYDKWDGEKWVRDDEKLTAANKQKAIALLTETDFVEVPSVSDPSKSPYLDNVQAFIDYRDALRVIAVHPTPDAVFPDKPEEIWS